MKKCIPSVFVSLALILPGTALGFSWESTQKLTLRCAVQPYSVTPGGRKILGALRSVCPAELKANSYRASFVIDGRAYVATLADSEQSDGGDLNDLTIEDADGRVVAQADMILAFGDVIFALSGADDRFQLVQDE
jgi:hypothetical protein